MGAHLRKTSPSETREEILDYFVERYGEEVLQLDRLGVAFFGSGRGDSLVVLSLAGLDDKEVGAERGASSFWLLERMEKELGDLG